MDNEKYSDGLVFFDLLFNLLCCFIILFSLAYILVNEQNKSDRAVENTAEFLITFIWANEIGDDVDAYVEDPLGNLVFFRRREEGLMHLDRDDLGKRNDVVRLADGTTVKSDENKEIVTIRGIIPGEYVVNTHMYYKTEDSEQTEVTIKLEKINPKLRLITQKTVILSDNGDEKTAFRFNIDK